MPIPVRARLLSGLAIAVPLVLLAACGGGDGANAAAGGDADATVVSPGLSFEPVAVTVPAGEVTLVYENQDEGVPHNLHVQGVDAKTSVEPGPDTQELTFTAEAGEYTFVCDIHPNMKGTLTVTG
jgi:plastocyanin